MKDATETEPCEWAALSQTCIGCPGCAFLRSLGLDEEDLEATPEAHAPDYTGQLWLH